MPRSPGHYEFSKSMSIQFLYLLVVMLYVPVNNFWVKSGRFSVFMVRTQFLQALTRVQFDSLCPSQNNFSHVGMGLPGLNQYLGVDKVSCSRTHSDSASEETGTSNPSIVILTLHQLSHCQEEETSYIAKLLL